MTPLELLGLPPDADARAVKRAYAQRLRQTRPETDPDGFQRLHAIYQAALEGCRNDVDAAPTDAKARATEPPATGHPDTPAASEADIRRPAPVDPARAPPTGKPVTFDGPTFYAELLARAELGDAASLQTWLQRQPALWSLPLKARVGRDVLQTLFRHPASMPSACLDEILRFFDLDHALSGVDPLNLQQLERRMQLSWTLRPGAFDQSVGRLHSTMSEGFSAGRIAGGLRQLSRPLRYRQAVPAGLWPRAPHEMKRFIHALCGHRTEDLPPSIDRAQVTFWLDAADPGRVSRPRLMIGIARCLVAILLAAVVGLVLAPLLAWRPDSQDVVVSYAPAISLVMLAVIASGLWGLWMAWLPLDRWYSAPMIEPGLRFRTALVPVMCAIGLLLRLERPWHPIAGILLLVSMLLAARRLIRRQLQPGAKLSRTGSLRLLMLSPLALSALFSGAQEPSSIAWLFDGGGFAIIAMLLWAIDRYLDWRSQRRSAR